MTIIELLKSENGFRLSNMGKWIVYDSGEWEVYKQVRGRGVLVLKTESEEQAVNKLMEI